MIDLSFLSGSDSVSGFGSFETESREAKLVNDGGSNLHMTNRLRSRNRDFGDIFRAVTHRGAGGPLADCVEINLDVDASRNFFRCGQLGGLPTEFLFEDFLVLGLEDKNFLLRRSRGQRVRDFRFDGSRLAFSVNVVGVLTVKCDEGDLLGSG